MSHLITTLVGQTRELDEWRTYLNTLITNTTLKVKLFKNDYTPNRNTTQADLTEANFTGYAAKTAAVAFGAVFTNADNQAEIDGGEVYTWTASDAVTPNSIYGYWVYDTAAAELLWVERFDAAANMTTAGRVINLTLRYMAESKF